MSFNDLFFMKKQSDAQRWNNAFSWMPVHCRCTIASYILLRGPYEKYTIQLCDMQLITQSSRKKLIIEGRINYLYWSGKIKITIFSRWCQYKWQVLTYHSGLIKMLLYHDIAVVISIEHINVLCFVKYLRCTTSI